MQLLISPLNNSSLERQVGSHLFGFASVRTCRTVFLYFHWTVRIPIRRYRLHRLRTATFTRQSMHVRQFTDKSIMVLYAFWRRIERTRNGENDLDVSTGPPPPLPGRRLPRASPFELLFYRKILFKTITCDSCFSYRLNFFFIYFIPQI